MFTRIAPESGMTILEVLVASVIGFIAILGVINAYLITSKAIRHSKIMSLAIAVESQIISDLKDPNFMSSFRSALMLTGTAPGLTILYQTQAVAKMGSTQIDIEGMPCAGTACVLETQADIRCVDISGQRNCYAAYRILPINQSTPMVGLGVPGNAPFQPAEYNTTLAFEQYLRAANGVCATGEFMTGIDKFSGQAICAPGPTSATCPSGDIFQGYIVSATTITLKCLPKPVAKCDYPYVIKTAHFTFTNGSADCVLGTQSSGPMPNPWVPAPVVDMVACPPAFYDVVPIGSCTVGTISPVAGTCCTTDPVTLVVTCPYAPDPTVVVSSYGAGSLHCSVVPTFGACGSTSTGNAVWNANCVRKPSVPETYFSP